VRVEHALFREWLFITENRFRIAASYNTGYPGASIRNKIVLNFLADPDADWLLMIDDDQLPEFNPLNYIEYDKDILGWPYPSTKMSIKNDPICWYPAPPNSDVPMAQVDVVGSGMMLVAKRVFQHPDMRAPFADKFNEDGLFIEGEDYTFCRRATAAGFGVWCAMDRPILHIKPNELVTAWSAYNG
jgi:hypothetical protein